MMWNTGNRTAKVSPDQAVAIANRWLQTNAARPERGHPRGLSGLLHNQRSHLGRQEVAVSVNATTGAVWNHTWHAQFLAEEDA